MNISSVGLDPSVGISGSRSSLRQADQSFDQLFQSLQSGNLAGAQQAYNSFQQIQAGLTGSSTTPTSVTSATAANPVATDWSALGQALQSGSLSSAQGALGKLEQDAQVVWQSHLQQQAQNAQSVYALMQSAAISGTTSASASANPTPASNPVQNDLNALSQALQSGDTASAQKLLAQLEQDLQTSSQASGQSYGGHHHHHHHHDATAATSQTSTPVSPVSAPTSTSASTPTAGSSGAAA